MKISHNSHPGPWKVYHRGEELRMVEWIDTDTRQWCAYDLPMRLDGGELTRTVYQARRIEVDFPGWRVLIDAPEVPPEIHNPRPVNADRCMAAVRAMCGEGGK